MRKVILNIKPILFTILFLGCLLNISAQTKKVMVIGIDGTRSDALTVANTPNIDLLIANGLYAPDAYNDDITISGPGWSSILCGVRSDKHLVVNNNFDGNNYDQYPTFFHYIEAFDPDLNTISVVHWSPINDFIVGDDADEAYNISSDSDIGDFVASHLGNSNPDVIFVAFDDVDHAGHGSGFSPTNPAYIGAIEEIDGYIGVMISALQQRPTYDDEDWLILLTTDHGGLGTSHGGTSHEERNIFLIISGDNVPLEVIHADSTIVYEDVVNCLAEETELRFDGSADYAYVQDNSLFNFGTDQDFTIECRVRTNVASDVAIVTNKNWQSGVNPGFVFSFKYANGPEWKINIGDGANRQDINIGGSIADNEWHTLSVTFDRDGMMKMYEDGNFVAEEDISNIGDINTNAGLYFGSDINGGYSYNGAIAEVRVWNSALEATAISDWACTSLDNTHPNDSDLIGYWKMNEGSGDISISDSSPYDNPCFLNGPHWEIPDSTIVYDYSESGRQMDIGTNLMTHLCMPIDPNWELEGTLRIEDCQVVNNISLKHDFSFDITPNPATDQLTISTGDNAKINHIKLYTSLGQLILQKDDTNVLNISQLNEGIYMIHVKIGDQLLSRKVVIK